jgi:hypothetical protein
LRGCVDALANAGINIYALATSDTVDHTVVCTVVSDPTKALMLLGEAGVLALETYLAAGREAEKGLIILRPSDVERARRALEEL